ncbi:glycoside hydrolase family 3 N-terminal domain-containing protein [Corynebacterium urealyticum]|nr:glycoside hydrolase family 3 N-terminal domain-containing protein [Corynebacterium urealyticum]WOH94596.1 glycoside hydrolase family 3 N-terminal domain-containing protein [Corynebacterium urealyticum]
MTTTSPASAPETTPPAPQVPAEELAPKLLAVGVTDFESARAAVDAGVRHLFFGTGSDFSMLNGQGDPERSIAALQRRAGEPLRVSVDEEGGMVQRLSELIGTLPAPRDMARTMTLEQVRTMMAEHGRKMAGLGFTVDFAPSVDLAGGENIEDNAIGSRSFGADPQVVARYGRAYVEGLLDAGITPVLKHFPGHGHANGDSHTGEVFVPPVEQLKQADLKPFAELATIPGVEVMMGHVQAPDLNPDEPASVSPAAYELLRKGWEGFDGYQGVVYTDDLTGMRAVTDRYPGAEAVVAALSAGADQGLTAAGAFDLPELISAVTEAIRSGEIAPEQAQRSAERLAPPARETEN